MVKRIVWIVMGLCLALGLGVGFTAPRASGGASAKEAALLPGGDAWAAALPRDPEQATQAYMARIPPQARARSEAYFRGGYLIQAWSLAATLAAGLLLLATGAAAAMRDRAERAARRPFAQALIFALQYLAAMWVLDLPTAVITGFLREHRYGMATQAFGPWLAESLVSLAVSALLMAPAIALFYGMVRRRPRTWWAWGAGGSVVFMVVAIAVAPPLIDPLFNKYRPLEDGPARREILSLARANGIPARDVLQFDASRQTTKVSANVSGLLGTTSIRLNDNLLNRCSLPEIKAVMAHEMGHYVLNHVWKFVMFLGLVLAAAFAAGAWAFEALRRRFPAWDIRDAADPAGLPLLAMVLAVALTAAGPLVGSMIRVQETEADQFGVNASQEPDGFAEAQLKLIEYRAPDPGPVEEFLFYDHPSPRKRILTAMRWKAEHPR